MAYSCVKVQFEIGHEASIRAKRTPEGFTHDWEVFVRGADNSEIYHFVEKVVFYLHETFPKPKRVVKEPPYSVKESGYAGFNLPIEIYFKNSDEPKKVRYNYDLHLQTSGPPINKVLKEQYVFPNPAEDLRRRLIKGGGVGVLGSESNFHLTSCEKVSTPIDDSGSHKHIVPALVGKPKLSSGGDSSKKHKKESKIDEPRTSNSFHDLFGPPIKTKVSPDPKKSSHSPKVSPVSKPQKVPEKSSSADKVEKSSKSSKHGRESKDSERGSSAKDEKKEKEKNREKEKSKEKKRPPTPVKSSSTPPKRLGSPPKRPVSPLPKRPPSPSPVKLLAPPTTSKLATSPKHSSSTKLSKDEAKKTSSEEIKSRSELKSGESGKSEKKKKDKKNRDEKPKKDKHKEHEKGSEKPSKGEKSKESKEKDANKKAEKDGMKEPEKSREKDKEKSKHGDGEKEKQRHKHKKKDKSNKDREKDKDKDKSSKKSSESKLAEVKDKEKNGLANESSRGSADTSSDISAPHKKQAAPSPFPSPVRPSAPSPVPEKTVSSLVKDKLMKRPIALLSDDSSDSNSSLLSVDEDVDRPINRINSINSKSSDSGVTPNESKASAVPLAETQRPSSRSEISKPKSENLNQERNSLSKNSGKQKEKSSKKSKERDSAGGEMEKESKKKKRKSGNRTGDESESLRNNGETPAAKIPRIKVEDDACTEPEPLQEKAAAEEDIEMKDGSDAEDSKLPATHLTEEYVSELRDLQHKIMALEDNSELQRVVQVIAETGQYEITKKTFDFDLCALDKSTVKRLQAFFTPS